MNKFELWKEYESIAMHFNTLLIQLRVRALASITAIATILAYATKISSSPAAQHTILGISLIVLSIIWIAIYIIDIHYYNKLLIGAVQAITDLEEEKEYDENSIKFSSTVKDIVNGKAIFIYPIILFYIIIFLLFFIGGLFLIN